MTIVHGSIHVDTDAVRTMATWPESTMFFDGAGGQLSHADKRLAFASTMLDAELEGLRASLWESLVRELER